MRKLVLGLAASTLVFGASTLYQWRALQLERSRQGATTVRSSFTAPGDSGVEPDLDVMAQRQAWARDFLAKTGSAEGRAHLLADNRHSYRAEYTWAVKRLALSADEFDQLVELRARQDLAASEARRRLVPPATTWWNMASAAAQMLEEAVEQNGSFQSLPSAAIRAVPQE